MKFAFLFSIFLSAFSLSLYSAEQQLIVIRHGEAGNNIEKVYNSNPENPNYKIFNLTKAGILATQKTAKDLIARGFSSNNIVAVFVSPLPRTKQTADILVQEGLVSKDKVIIDKRLIELNAGDLEGKPTFPEWKSSFAKDYHAESLEHVKNRVKEFYDSILQQYPQGNIIVVTHGVPADDLIDLVAHQVVKLKPGEAKVVPLRQ
jgi:ribonuclease H / adenosylcobalamin/alpha-ribazole phosphatase